MPKLKFKGQPVATVIRSRVDGNTTQQSTTDGSAAASSPSDEPDFKSSLPFIEKLAASKTSQQRKRLVEEITKDSPITTASSQALAVPTFIKPHYQIIHRGTVDMADFTGDRHRPDATRPRELLIRIDLAGVSSISSIELDTDVRALSLSVPSASPPFKLDITLPHDVEPTLGTAKFNKEAARLTVVLPVRRIIVERVGPEEQVPLERAEDAVVAEPKVVLIQELPEEEQAVDTAPIEKKMAVPEMVSKENVPEMVANEAIPEETVPDAPAKPDHTMPSSTIAESAPIAKELQAPATAIAQPLAPTLPSLSTLSNSLLFDLDD